MTFEDQLKFLVYCHLEEDSSGRNLFEVLCQKESVANYLFPLGEITKSALSEAIDSRGLRQMKRAYEHLQKEATAVLPVSKDLAHLGDLVAIDSLFIDAVSLPGADSRKKAQKIKVYLVFDLVRGIPKKVILGGDQADKCP